MEEQKNEEDELRAEVPDLGPLIKTSRISHWVEMPDEQVEEMYESMFRWAEDEELDNLDHERMCYDVYDEHYYREKFPGFDDKFYAIMAESSKKENKVQDFRPSPLRIDTGVKKPLDPV